jgi:hypothetical protein
VSSLDIDTTVLRGIANSVRSIADTVPKAPVIDLAASGSASVASAAESFNLWAVLTGTLLAGKLDSLAGKADAAALAYEVQEQEAADAAAQP